MLTDGRARRYGVLAGLVGVLLFLVLRTSCGSATAQDASDYCRALTDGTEQFLRQHPDAPAAALRRQTEDACDNRPLAAAPTAVAPVERSPGCQALPSDGEPRVPLSRRTARPPARPVPFFARRAAALPPDGTPVVGGVRLPPGSACLHHWASDGPLADPLGLAARLADAFPQTGLWPLLWDVPDDGPDNYMNATEDPDAAARLDAETILRRAWAGFGRADGLPGLAPGSVLPAGSDDGRATFSRARTPSGPSAPRWILLLVPVHRPADVISVLGPYMTEVMSDAALTAVLRSWEERFGAVPTTLGPGTLGLSVAAPPTRSRQATMLAAEQVAFAPEDDWGPGRGALRDLAQRLRTAGPDTLRGRGFWSFGWPD